MIRFNTEEQNLICLYDPGSRDGMIYELREMQKELTPDEGDLEALTRSVLEKLERMTDAEYREAVGTSRHRSGEGRCPDRAQSPGERRPPHPTLAEGI